MHVVKTHFLLENLGISEPSLSKLEKILSININIIFHQIYVLVVSVCFQIFFLTDAHCKPSIRNLWNPRKCQIRLMFLQDAAYDRHLTWAVTIALCVPPSTETKFAAVFSLTPLAKFYGSMKHISFIFPKCFHWIQRNQWQTNICQ